MFENSFTKLAKYIVPVTSQLEDEYSYITLDGRITKTNPIITPKGKSISDVRFVSLLAKEMGIDIPDNNKDFFNNYVSGKYGIPAISFEEIDGYIVMTGEHSYKETSYSYREPQKGTKEIFVNAKYHNGIITTFAAIKCEDETCKRDYYFEPDLSIISGADACFDGKCSISDSIAKGIILIPKNK